jgi:hypothetical protein
MCPESRCQFWRQLLISSPRQYRIDAVPILCQIEGNARWIMDHRGSFRQKRPAPLNSRCQSRRKQTLSLRSSPVPSSSRPCSQKCREGRTIGRMVRISVSVPSFPRSANLPAVLRVSNLLVLDHSAKSLSVPPAYLNVTHWVCTHWLHHSMMATSAHRYPNPVWSSNPSHTRGAEDQSGKKRPIAVVSIGRTTVESSLAYGMSLC